MQITEGEYAKLIRASTDGRFVACNFVGNRVFLEDTPDNEWAKSMVAEMRRGQPSPIFLPDGGTVHQSTD